jgi:2'-5' RNA ligase
LSEKIRSFISVDITDDQLLSKLIDLQQMFVGTGADLKLVERANLHFTMRFLGDVSTPTLDKICEEMKTISFRPFEINMRGVGVFPNIRRINVIWVGVVEGETEIFNLFNQIESKIKKIGFPPDPKGFSPHLTIARTRTGRNKDKLAKLVTELSHYDVGRMKVDALRLKKSVLTPKGPIYSTVYEVKAQ